ncbi:helix-turn-helix domain-containing protein [Paenarthrobacter sp. NPDC089322]|uniref:helix-turn-helix domain-containing protein n=1 Tax=Paenarthrobacter sp. NPDC089322 TaxID=3155065 RepID=UPI00342FA37F
MANRPAGALGLREGDSEELLRLSRSTAGRAGLAQRARIVMLAAEGLPNTVIAERIATTRTTVIGWRNWYKVSGD